MNNDMGGVFLNVCDNVWAICSGGAREIAMPGRVGNSADDILARWVRVRLGCAYATKPWFLYE